MHCSVTRRQLVDWVFFRRRGLNRVEVVLDHISIMVSVSDNCVPQALTSHTVYGPTVIVQNFEFSKLSVSTSIILVNMLTRMLTFLILNELKCKYLCSTIQI